MNIHFYLNDNMDTIINSMNNVESNPFKIGDIISLDVSILYPKDYSHYRSDTQKQFIVNNTELRNKFHLKIIKIIEENKFMKFNLLSEGILTIEYFCEFVTK